MEIDLENLLLKVIKIGVILVLFTPLVIGLFGLSLSEYPKTIYFRTLTEIILIVYLILLLNSGFNFRYLPKISLLVLTVLIFFGILGFSTFTSFNPERSFWGTLEIGGGMVTYLHLLVFLWIIIGVFQKKEDWLSFLGWALVVSTISGIAGILQKLGIAGFYGINLPERISGTLSNPVYFGSFLVLSVFIGLFLLVEEKKKNLKIIWGFLTFFNFYVLILSGTRGAWLGLALGLILAGLFYFFFCPKANPKWRKAILLGILASSSLMLFLVLNQETLGLSENLFFQRGLSIFSFDLEIIESRLPSWKIAIEAWQERPILGWGLESFNFLYEKYFQASYHKLVGLYITFNDPHNKILSLLATSGLIGTLSYLSIFVVLFYLLFQQKEKLSSFVLIALFIAYFVQNLFAFDTMSTYLVFFLLLGLANFYGAKSDETAFKTKQSFGQLPSINILRALAIIFLFLTILSLYFVNLKPALANLDFIKAFNQEPKDYSRSLELYQKGIERNTVYDRELKLVFTLRLLLALDTSFGKKYEKEIVDHLSRVKPFLEKIIEKPDMRYLNAHELLAKTNEQIYLTSRDPKALKDMERITEKALSFNDQWMQFHYLMGTVRIYQKNYSEGEAFFQKGYELSRGQPNDKFEFYKSLGMAYFKEGNNFKAAENLKKAVNLKYRFKKINPPSPGVLPERTIKEVSFIEGVAWLHYQLGDKQTALEIYQKALEIHPEHESRLRFNMEKLK